MNLVEHGRTLLLFTLGHHSVELEELDFLKLINDTR